MMSSGNGRVSCQQVCTSTVLHPLSELLICEFRFGPTNARKRKPWHLRCFPTTRFSRVASLDLLLQLFRDKCDRCCATVCWLCLSSNMASSFYVRQSNTLQVMNVEQLRAFDHSVYLLPNAKPTECTGFPSCQESNCSMPVALQVHNRPKKTFKKPYPPLQPPAHAAFQAS